MRYYLEFTTKFKKNYKKCQKRGLEMQYINLVIEKLQNGEMLDKKYRDHLLKGRYAGYHECHIQPDWILVYKIQNDVLILTLVDTGSHADLFGL